MCGRFTLRASPELLAQVFELVEIPDWAPRYNIAPTQDVGVIRHDARHRRQWALLHWGLIPSWADDPGIGNRMINARAETVASKPSFRSAFKRRRCLVAADGYYEWKKVGSSKQPFYIHREDDRPFAFAGLWEAWTKATPPLESCTIITTDANERTRAIHDRMPVILKPEDYDAWLDPDYSDVDALRQLLVPNADEPLRADPVSTYVNNVRNQGKQCIEVQPN